MTWCRNMNSEWLAKHGYPAINTISDEEKLTYESQWIMDRLDFLAWAEKTHPAYLNNLKRAYERVKEGEQ